MTQIVKVLSEGTRPPNEKRVIALLHDTVLRETRQIVTIMQFGFNAHDHITANFAALWAEGVLVEVREWLKYDEVDHADLYRDIVAAAKDAARGQGATLVDVNNAMEMEIVGSPREAAYNKLVSLMTGATAADRTEFFALMAFVVLGRLLE